MNMRQIHQDIVKAVELPRIVQLKSQMYAAVFSVMKLLPARFILDKARDMGELSPEMTVIETTSGTFGLALAMLCNQRAYRLILVSDPAIDTALQQRLEILGAKVEIVRDPAPTGGYQGARLARLAELQKCYPNHFWPNQYDNIFNSGAYALLAELLTDAIGEVDCLIGTVGSGGSMCGTSRYLRLLFPHLHVIGVDTPGSVLFGHTDGKRLLRGLGNSIMPKNVDHAAFDEIHWVSAAEGFLATKELYKNHAIFMGPTSGAAFLVARWWATQHPDAKVVVIFPDEGYRYQNTVYSDEWLRTNKVWLQQLPSIPRQVMYPQEADNNWTYLHWQRRTYEEVLGRNFVTSENV